MMVDHCRTHIPVAEKLLVADDELSRLKLDMAVASKAKNKAEKKIESYRASTKSYQRSVQEIRKHIEASSEEHVLVELARIDAERELRQIESQRVAEATYFSESIGIARKKITDLKTEIDCSKRIEEKLAGVNSDIITLRNAMEMVRAMKIRDEESAEVELKAAKKERESIREEGFQLMTAMDIVREELMNIAIETEQLNRVKKKADSLVPYLNYELLKAKSKLESALVSGERTRAKVSDLWTILQRIQTEIGAAVKEEEDIKNEVKAAESDIKLAEEGLGSAMQELEAVKTTEAFAINKLKYVRERIMRSRTSPASLQGSITISESEYDYLRRRGAEAQVVADKKVAAAMAWIEALEAEEKEILMKREFAERIIAEMGVVKEQQEQVNETDKSLLPEQEEEKNERRKPRKSVAVKIKLEMRRSTVSLGARYNPRSPSFTIKKRANVMPNLVKLLEDRRILQAAG